MKSPLKEKPLRLPGQSLDEEFDKIYDEKVMFALLSIVVMFSIILFEWVQFYYPVQPHPIVMTAFGVLVIGFYSYRIHKYKLQLRNIVQGRDGERVVGQQLEGLRANGCSIFHDILGPKFNIDHVIVSPKGIFTVETKTWSKSDKEKMNMIGFDGTDLTVNGRKPQKDPIVQCRAEASWLRELIKKTTGKDFEVSPVIVFPDWWVDSDGTRRAKGKGVWLLNPKVLPTFLNEEKNTLTKEDVNLITFHISRYIQSL